MEKLKSAINTLTNLKIELKYAGKHANPLFSYILILLGAYKLITLLDSAYVQLLYP